LRKQYVDIQVLNEHLLSVNSVIGTSLCAGKSPMNSTNQVTVFMVLRTQKKETKKGIQRK
jgi:hypothetical protein